MTEEIDKSQHSSQTEWLLDPPGPDSVSLHISTGGTGGLNDQARQALDRLLNELNKNSQDNLTDAGGNSCQEYVDTPKCAGFYHCKICCEKNAA